MAYCTKLIGKGKLYGDTAAAAGSFYQPRHQHYQTGTSILFFLRPLLTRQATTQLNTQFYKQPTCIPALYEISCTDQNQAVRALNYQLDPC
jgi:hypothetical protein